MNYRSKNKQSGVALITAVLIVALAVVASISIAENYQLNFRRTVTTFNSGQAWSYAKGAEEWAMAVLARDARDSTLDAYHEDELWWNFGNEIQFPVPGGIIIGQLEDAQSKLNVNALKQGDTVNVVVRQRFDRLFTLLDINPGLVCAIIDWIDSDSSNPECALGAEADIYNSLEVAYLPADQPMQDISELRLVYGITEEIYARLLPHITALPANAPLNLNTTTAEVLQSLAANMPATAGEDLVETRSAEPFKSIQDIQTHPSMSQQGINIDVVNISFATDHFILSTTSNIGASQVKMVSMIRRGGGNNLVVVKRSQKL